MCTCSEFTFCLTFRVQYFLINAIKVQKLDWEREKDENFPLSLCMFYFVLLDHKNYVVQIILQQFFSWCTNSFYKIYSVGPFPKILNYIHQKSQRKRHYLSLQESFWVI